MEREKHNYNVFFIVFIAPEVLKYDPVTTAADMWYASYSYITSISRIVIT